MDRTLFTSTGYPADNGFVPGTYAEDDDPIDVLVLLGAPTFPGCVIEVRPIAVFWMRDEHGPDAKLLCVPANDPRYATVQNLDDVPLHLRNEIAHFFDVYKDLEPHKVTEIGGWQGRDEAVCALDRSVRRQRDRDNASPGT